MTPSEIRDKTPAEQNILIHDLREELFKLRMQGATGQLEKNHRFVEIKKDIARVLTIIKEKSTKEMPQKAV